MMLMLALVMFGLSIPGWALIVRKVYEWMWKND